MAQNHAHARRSGGDRNGAGSNPFRDYRMTVTFAHASGVALNWNLGEENTQSAEQQRDMSQYIRTLDPYRHHIVVHTHPGWQDVVYSKLIGDQSVLTGASLQNPWSAVHERTLKWIAASRKAGKPWVVANDEQGSALLGVPPDPGYKGFSGKDPSSTVSISLPSTHSRRLLIRLVIQIRPSGSNANPSGKHPCPSAPRVSGADKSPFAARRKRVSRRPNVSTTYSHRPLGSGRTSFA
jgi:hypothetical protein